MLRTDGKYVIDNSQSFGDKSITHRALILGSIASDKVIINNAAINDDTLSTMRCLAALGAEFSIADHTVTVTPIRQLPKERVELYCGNSGTTARLLAGLVCGLNVNAVFSGDKSLSRRPMDRVILPLRSMGANIIKRYGILMEVQKSAGLNGIQFVPQSPSAQVKSAVILAGLFAKGKTTVCESIATRNHTELMAQWLGCDIDIAGKTVSVCQSRPRGGVIDVPQDLSTAAFLTALALKQGVVRVDNVGLNPTRTGFVEVLQRSGAEIQVSDSKTLCGELRGNLTVKFERQIAPLHTTAEQSAYCIDELPILATLACFIEGESVFCGVGELRHKESDRITSIIKLCKSIGREAYCNDDSLHVAGSNTIPKHCVEVDTFSDHRIAMCGLIAAAFCGSAIVDDEKCIDVSTPNFNDILSIKKYKCALLGQDISQSKSPLLMSIFAENSNINMSYELLDIDQSVSDSQLLTLLSQYDGVNVTMPYKQRIAKLTGADCQSVNTIGKGIVPCSTDGYGLMQALKSHGIDVNGKNILVVGAGGTAVVAVEQLLQQGAKVNIINRTQSKADGLAQQFGIDYKLNSFDGIVSCIPQCEYEDSIPIDDSVTFVFSTNYKQRSRLLQRAYKLGITAIDGLSMLYWQGAKSFELWTGRTPKDECYSQFLQKVKQ